MDVLGDGTYCSAIDLKDERRLWNHIAWSLMSDLASSNENTSAVPSLTIARMSCKTTTLKKLIMLWMRVVSI